jgi:membrane protein
VTDSADTQAPAPSGVPDARPGIAKRVVRLALTSVQAYFADLCPQHAAAISYRVLFSMAPLGIVLVSILGLVLRDDSIRQDVVDAIVDALPVSAEGKADVEEAISAIATPASAAGFLSLVLFTWAATGMMTAIRRGLESAMHVTESRPMARGKLVDLALVVGASALVLVVVALTVVGDLLQRSSDTVGESIGLGTGTLAHGLLRGASFVLSTIVVLLVYRFVPARGLRIRDGLAGALVTAVLLQLISLGSSWIYEKTTRLSLIYGSLTVALVFLYSMYLCASALLLGAEVAAAGTRPPPDDEPTVGGLRKTVSGLFIRQKPTPATLALPGLVGDDVTPEP